jgi:5-methylcytosine-specific restriction endonuclease McrA
VKHKRTKATEIPKKVKEIVWKRDNESCIHCGRHVTVFCANSHYIKRSQGGLGIPQNITTACPYCHNKGEFSKDAEKLKEEQRQYLSRYYGDSWKEEKLIYKKGAEYA